jgi:hypothetical protein
MVGRAEQPQLHYHSCPNVSNVNSIGYLDYALSSSILSHSRSPLCSGMPQHTVKNRFRAQPLGQLSIVSNLHFTYARFYSEHDSCFLPSISHRFFYSP